MAEVTLDVRGVPRPTAYADVDAHLDAVLEGIQDRVAVMATMSAVLHHGFGFLWTGFYQILVPGRVLVVGPYQGTLGCLTIEFGRGVCGHAAATRRTLVVPDVRAFPGHIVCDARSRSEIVVPVFDARRDLIAVLDIDADTVRAFGDDDAAGLEMLVRRFARPGSAPR
ncbi:MAG TPA: GAF domain-containing protein [Gemmatimonadaceae bacterium]|nr:GAF domain-containing protein [Gemmatimonadaceae bacterium]